MNYYIIIRGPAGVGKTTITNKLAEYLKAHIISIDKVLTKHNLNYVVGEQCVKEINCLKANDLVISEAVKKLKKQIIIFEGNFYHKSQIQDLIKKLPYSNFIFTLKADVEKCISRDKTRKGIGEKRIKDVHKLVDKFDYGIIIDTNNQTEDGIINEIISHLPNYYNEISQGYEELHKEEQEKKIELIKQYLKPKKDEKLLDVGCGTGLTTRPWQCKRFGLDPSKKLLEKAINKDPEGNYTLASAENIPFKDHEFDVVISITAIQNFNNLEKGLNEIKRVGKDKFILTFLKKSSKADKIASLIQQTFNISKILKEDKDIIMISRGVNND